MPDEKDGQSAPEAAGREPFDPWRPPSWFQSLAHEHAEHLLTIVEFIEHRRSLGPVAGALARHIVLESDRYLDILGRHARGILAGDQDATYHVERLKQHILLTRDMLVAGELRPATVLELLHHFIEEQSLYLDEESCTKVLEAGERAERSSRWTIGSLMEIR
jgi:hypothetical protein